MKKFLIALFSNPRVRYTLLALTSSALLVHFGITEAQGDYDLGSVATSVTSTFGKVAKLITATAYISGLGFSIGAMLKFKQHKDNPTQIPIGTPIALLFIAAALIFLPNIFGVTGATLFGSSATVAGPKGIIYMGS